jgi:hypothetical protein
VDSNRPYDVGYGRPPQSGQFTKGRSGNPKGRPKGSKNLATIVLRESLQKVRVNGPGGPRLITKLEATVMQIGNRAAQGDLRSAKELLALVQRSELELNANPTSPTYQELDRRVLENIRRRFSGFDTATKQPPSGSGA